MLGGVADQGREGPTGLWGAVGEGQRPAHHPGWAPAQPRGGQGKDVTTVMGWSLGHVGFEPRPLSARHRCPAHTTPPTHLGGWPCLGGGGEGGAEAQVTAGRQGAAGWTGDATAQVSACQRAALPGRKSSGRRPTWVPGQIQPITARRCARLTTLPLSHGMEAPGCGGWRKAPPPGCEESLLSPRGCSGSGSVIVVKRDREERRPRRRHKSLQRKRTGAPSGGETWTA